MRLLLCLFYCPSVSRLRSLLLQTHRGINKGLGKDAQLTVFVLKTQLNLTLISIPNNDSPRLACGTEWHTSAYITRSIWEETQYVEVSMEFQSRAAPRRLRHVCLDFMQLLVSLILNKQERRCTLSVQPSRVEIGVGQIIIGLVGHNGSSRVW